MLIKSLTLENFLSYGEKQTIDLNPLNVIIGTNGCGKSNLIEAIELLRNSPTNLTDSIREGGGVNDWLWKGSENTPVALIETIFNYSNDVRQNLRHSLFFSSVSQRFEIISEKIEDEKPKDNKSKPYFYYSLENGKATLNYFAQENNYKTRYLHQEDIDYEKSIFAQRRDSIFFPEITWIANKVQDICIYRDWNFGRYTPPRLPQKVDLPNKYLSKNCDNLGLILNKLSMTKKVKDRMLLALKELNPSITDFMLQIEGGTVQLFIQEGNITIPATRLSDGTLRFMCLLAILCNPNPPALICIEEPELGLHPDIIPTIAQLLKEASENCQIIITTHSAILVDCFTEYPEDVIVAEKESNTSSLKRLKKEDLLPWLQKYRLGHLWLQGELGGIRW